MKTIALIATLLISLSGSAQTLDMHFGENLKVIKKRIHGSTDGMAFEQLTYKGLKIRRTYVGNEGLGDAGECNTETLWVETSNIADLEMVLADLGLIKSLDGLYEGGNPTKDSKYCRAYATVRKTTLKEPIYEALIRRVQ